MKVAIVNGPNLNLLGTREPEVYGKQSFEAFFEELTHGFNGELSYFQSNIEGELIDFLQQFKGDGILFNAGGYTHTSVAIRD
jgi:3-dehydroquinate dehydratase-2